MNCTNCGTPLNDDAKFCTKCGTVIQPTSETTPQPIPVNEQTNPNQRIYPMQNLTLPHTPKLNNAQHNAIHFIMTLIIIILGITTIYYYNEYNFWHEDAKEWEDIYYDSKDLYNNYLNRSPEEKTKDALNSWFN